MLPNWDILQAMLHCEYKAWQLARTIGKQIDTAQQLPISPDTPILVPAPILSPSDKLILASIYQSQFQSVKQVPVQYCDLNNV